MNNLNIPRELFLGLNNDKASFQLLRSQIEVGKEINNTRFCKIPVRVFYRTLWYNYSFVFTYWVYSAGDIHITITKRVYAKNRDDYLALRSYCRDEVYAPCDPLRNYLRIIGLVHSDITTSARHGIWIDIK